LAAVAAVVGYITEGIVSFTSTVTFTPALRSGVFLFFYEAISTWQETWGTSRFAGCAYDELCRCCRYSSWMTCFLQGDGARKRGICMMRWDHEANETNKWISFLRHPNLSPAVDPVYWV
jgi:hypothetical protein